MRGAAGRPSRSFYVTLTCLTFLFSNTGNSKEGVTINFINKNPNYNLGQIYVAFCGLIDPNQLAGTIINGAPLSLGKSYSLTDLQPGIQLTKFIGGRICIALGNPFASIKPSTGNNPNFNNPSLPDFNLRWDKAEITYNTTDPHSGINLSATDFFSVRLQIETFSQGALVTKLTWRQPIATVFHAIGVLSSFNKNAVLTDNTTGVPTDGPNFSKLYVVRIIAPSTIPAAVNPNPYPSFKDYINHVRANAIETNIQGTFNDVTTYEFTAVVDSTGALVMTGKITTSSVPQSHVIVIRANELERGIYTANPPIEIDGGPPQELRNDAFGTAVRDVLAGFNLGFIASNEPNPNAPGKTFGQSPSFKWYTPKLPHKYDFAGAQPNRPFYNQYAAGLVNPTDAYGFPYTDLTQSPFAGLKPGTIDRMDITVLPD